MNSEPIFNTFDARLTDDNRLQLFFAPLEEMRERPFNELRVERLEQGLIECTLSVEGDLLLLEVRDMNDPRIIPGLNKAERRYGVTLLASTLRKLAAMVHDQISWTRP